MVESSTLCKNAKQEHKRCSNPSHSNPTKATNAREGLERKNNGGNQQMNPRSRSNGFPSLRGGMDWWKCGSRSPLQKPSKRCKNHRRDGRGSKLKGSNNGGQFRAQQLTLTYGEEAPFIGSRKCGRWRGKRAARAVPAESPSGPGSAPDGSGARRKFPAETEPLSRTAYRRRPEHSGGRRNIPAANPAPPKHPPKQQTENASRKAAITFAPELRF